MEQKGNFRKNLAGMPVCIRRCVQSVSKPLVYMNTSSECGHNDTHKPINANVTYILDS